MGRACGGFAAFAKAAGTEASADRPAAAKRGSPSPRPAALRGQGSSSSRGSPGKTVTWTDSPTEGQGSVAAGSSCWKVTPAGSWGRYEVLLKRMIVRAYPSRQAPLLSCTKLGEVVGGVPYDIVGDHWLFLDEASCEDRSIKPNMNAWMMINGEGVGKLMQGVVDKRPAPAAHAERGSKEQEREQGGSAGPEALMRAVRSCDSHEAAQLLLARADPNACDELGETALFEAAVMGDAGTLSALLLAGSDPSVHSADGASAADLAARPLLAATLRAFNGNALERTNFCTNQAFQKEFGPAAHAGMIRQLERIAGLQRNASAPPPFMPTAPVRSMLPGHLEVKEVKLLEEARMRSQKKEAPRELDGDFDWGRRLWDARLERSHFRVALREGTRAMSSVPESPWVKARILEAGVEVHLLLSAQPYLGEEGQWVCVVVAADEELPAPSSLSSTPPLWWVQWPHLELVPSAVRTAGSHERAQAEKLMLKEAEEGEDEKKRHEKVLMYQLQARTRKFEDDVRMSQYQARVCEVAKVRFTSATINELGRFHRGRATTGVARRAERERKLREERLLESRQRELEDKDKLAKSAEDRCAEGAQARAAAALSPSAAVGTGAAGGPAPKDDSAKSQGAEGSSEAESMAEKARKRRGERLRQRELQRQLASAAEDRGAADAKAPATTAPPPSAAASASVGEGGKEGKGGGGAAEAGEGKQEATPEEDWAKCPAARAVSPEAVKGRVSVLVPTDFRRHYLHESFYRYFCMQEWPDKELVVLDTGGVPSPFFTERLCEETPGPHNSLQPSPLDDQRVRYVHVEKYGLTLGDKRNQMLQLASGEIVANFDDDNVYAPDYLTLMVEQLRLSGAQTVRLASCFSWDPFSNKLLWHDEMRGRGETFVHLKGPTRILRYDSKDIGEEEGFTASCVAHDVDDVFGIFVHVHHGENCSSLVQRQAKAPAGVQVQLADVPSRRLRAILPRRRAVFVERFGRMGPPMRWAHLADLNRAHDESEHPDQQPSQR